MFLIFLFAHIVYSNLLLIERVFFLICFLVVKSYKNVFEVYQRGWYFKTPTGNQGHSDTSDHDSGSNDEVDHVEYDYVIDSDDTDADPHYNSEDIGLSEVSSSMTKNLYRHLRKWKLADYILQFLIGLDQHNKAPVALCPPNNLLLLQHHPAKWYSQ